MSYKKILGSNSVVRVSDGATIPAQTDNADYREYLRWLAAGGILLDADQPTKNEVDAAAARQFQKLQNLMALSPAQVETWVTFNVIDLATARDAIATLAIAVSVLARRL